MSVMSSQQRMFRFGDSSTVLRPYVPILLAKRGERTGLAHLDTATRHAITPYLRVVPPELRRKDADAEPPREIGRLAGLLRDQTAYLDAAGTPRRKRRAAPLDAAYVRDIYAAAEEADMAFMPVYPYGRSDLAETIAEFTSESLGAAFLLPDVPVWGGARLRDRLREQVSFLRLDPHQLDLVVDLGYLAAGADDAASTTWLVREAAGAVPWRSVILAGTSVPDSVAMEVPDGSLNGIERRELPLFARVQAAVDHPLRFADYGSQYPVPPTPNAVPAMRASIRYQVGAFMLVSRGSRPLGEIPRSNRPGEYRDLAVRLRDHPLFNAGCCWADQRIEGIAEGRNIVRDQSSMRAVATCHHLTLVAAERTVQRRVARSTTPLGKPVAAPITASR